MFIETLKSAKNVFVLYFSLIVVASGMGHILFRKFLNVDVIENSWKSFIRSFITAFIFISTGDNFVDNIYPVANFRPIWVAYFLFFTIFGTIFVMALVLSFFQDGFTDSLRKKLRKLKIKDRLCMIGTFILIDLDESGTIDRFEFKQFVQSVNSSIEEEDISKAFEKINSLQSSEKENGVLNIKEFLIGIEDCANIIQNNYFETRSSQDFRKSVENEVFIQRVHRYMNILRWQLYPIVSSKLFDLFVLICIIGQVFILSAYGTVENFVVLDVMNMILVMINVIDVFIKIYVFRRAVSFNSFFLFLNLASISNGLNIYSNPSLAMNGSKELQAKNLQIF